MALNTTYKSLVNIDRPTFNNLPLKTQEMLLGFFICPVMLCLSFVFIADKMQVPNQLLAMIYGSMVGLMYYYVPFLYLESVFFWKPDNIIILCHPIMLTKISYTLDTYVLHKSKWQILIVATVGTGMFIGFFGFLLMVMTNKEINVVNIVAAGTTLSAIDVPDILTELNRIKNLEVVMDGESVFGAAFTIMCFTMCLGYYDGYITQWYHVVLLYIRFILLGMAMGFLIGKITALTFRLFYQDSYNASMTLLASCYAAYYLCENYIYGSATICTFLVGYCVSKERSRLAQDTDIKVQIVIDNTYYVVEFLNCIVLSAAVTRAMVQMYKGFDFAVAIGVYIMGNVLRILILLLLSPLLKRMGLGFNTTTLLTTSWAAKRGSLQLLQVIYIFYYKLVDKLGTELLCFTVVYLALSFLINMTSLGFILKYFGLIEFTMARKFNITNCISMIMEKKHKVVFTLKTNRLLSDLNWDLIHKATFLNNAYSAIAAEDKTNEFETSCPTCYKTIPYLSSAKDQHEYISDVRTKILKRQRITLVRLYELGLLTKNDLEIILQDIEEALNSTELKVNYSSYENFNYDVGKVWKKIESSYQTMGYTQLVWRRWAAYSCFKFMKYKVIKHIRLAIVILYTVLILFWLVLELTNVTRAARVVLWMGHCLVIFFFGELALIMIVFRWNSLTSTYFRNFWNWLGIIFLMLDFISIIASLANFHYIRVASLLRFLYLEQVITYLVPYLNKRIESKMDCKLALAYCFGIAIVASLDEVEANMQSICKIENVREYLTAQIQNDKMRMMDKLVMVQYIRPPAAVTMSTYQVELAILKAMYATAQEIRSAGVVEEFEYDVLNKLIENTINKINPSTAVQLNTAKTMLREIPWMGADEDIFEFLYANIMLRMWESGDIICEKGEFIDGVVVITQGLLKTTYEPDEDTLYNLETHGMLPVKELITDIQFTKAEEEYLFMGNRLGELSFLTKRAYNCRIEAMRNTSGLILTTEMLKLATEFNTDPIFGLECRMWKSVSCQMMWRILMEKVHYRNIAKPSLHSLMKRAFIPNITHYKVFQVTNCIDDIILVEGIVTNNLTKEKYIAPCHLPRSIHQLSMKGYTAIRPKILIIPRSTIDSYTVMRTSEEISELHYCATSPGPIGNESVRKNKRAVALEQMNFNYQIEDYGDYIDKQLEKMRRSSVKDTKTTSILDYLSKRTSKEN